MFYSYEISSNETFSNGQNVRSKKRKILSEIINIICIAWILIKKTELHWVKNAHIWSFSGPYFPAFGLNKDQKKSENEHVIHSVN